MALALSLDENEVSEGLQTFENQQGHMVPEATRSPRPHGPRGHTVPGVRLAPWGTLLLF